MDPPKVTSASSTDHMMLECPTCGHKKLYTVGQILIGVVDSCAGCGIHIDIRPSSSMPSAIADFQLSGNGETVVIHVAQRQDGVWSFLNDDEAILLRHLDRDSDRAIALIVSGMIETRIERTLISHLPTKDKTTQDKLFGVSRPLASFAAKLDLAYLMGLISSGAHKDLNIIREIRNWFAHRLKARDFSTQSVRDKTLNLKLVESYAAEASTDPKTGHTKFAELAWDAKPSLYLRNYDQRIKDAKQKFLMTAQLMTLRLAPCDLARYPLPLI